MRALYKSRHDTLLAALKNWNPDLRISGENAGVHLLLHFMITEVKKRLICLAQARGIKVYGLSEYYVQR